MTRRSRANRVDSCDGPALRAALQIAAGWLDANVDQINALNVFPVPDGDTGSNMSLTMRSAVAEASGTPPNATAGAVARAAAHGALMGARGNSGVILSQILRGLARGLDDKPSFGAGDLAVALAEGAATAYRGVIKPVEGTILTVARESAAEAETTAAAGGDLRELLTAVVAAGRESLARTPSLLPVLAEAGVVDAGGQGYLAFLEGLLRYFNGDNVTIVPREEPVARRPTVEQGQYGYCTEFLLRGQALDVETLRREVAVQGESALVVGDGSVVRVHVHTFDPGAVLSAAARFGSLHSIKIDNMADQHRDYLLSVQAEEVARDSVGIRPVQAERAFLPSSPPDGELSLVVVASGSGCTQLFRSLGAAVVVPGGQTMNPSTRDLIEAVESAPGQTVVLLPNNGNIVPTAQQAVSMTNKRVVVVPTLSVPQGVSAMMAYNFESDLDSNVRAMSQAAERVRTVETTRAVRAAKVDGLQVEEGAAIALLDGQLVATGADLAEVALTALARASAGDAELVTVIFGEAASRLDAEELSESISRRWPNLSVEVVDGGQPHYPFIISVE